jgi:hypothetical protein
MATNKVRSLHVAIIQQLVRKWERPWRHQRAIVLFAIRTLGSLFGNAARLDTFTADAIHRYQNLRQEKAGGSSINKETGVLQELLKRTGRWFEVGHDY